MKHNLKEAITDPENIMEYIEAMIEELEQFDLEKWCIEKGFGKLQAIVLAKFRDEVLGTTK